MMAETDIETLRAQSVARQRQLQMLAARQSPAQPNAARIEPRLSPEQRNVITSMNPANPNPASQGGVSVAPDTMPRSPVNMDAPPIQINGQWHPAGTTPEMIANMPAGFMFDPTTGQYRNPREDAARADRSAADAAIGGGMQGVSLGAGDEILGGISSAIEGRPTGALRLEQIRAALDQDREDHPLASILGEVGGALLIPGAAYKAGQSFLSNVGLAAGIGGGLGAGYAFNTGEGGLSERAARIPVGAALGAIGGAVATPVAMAIGRLGNSLSGFVRNRQLYNNGQLTPTGVQLLQRMGVDPAQMGDDFNREFARQAARLVDPSDARAVAEMTEFGIPALRPNVSGDVNDFAAIERIRRTGEGGAAETVRTALNNQQGAMRRAAETIATDISGGLVQDQGNAAAAVMQGLRQAQEAARQTAGAAYEALEAAGGGLRGTAVANMATELRARLQTAGLRISDQLTPNVQAALDDIQQMVAGAERGTVPFMSIERIRQNLLRLQRNANRGTLGQDQNAIGRLIGEFDGQVDDLMTTALTEGNAEVLQGMAQNARQLWSRYRQTFLGDGAGARFIQRMVDDDATPDQAARWLFGANKLGGGNFTANIARQVRDVLGDGSEEWNAIRQAAFRQMTMNTTGTTQPGPQQIRTAINEFVNGSLTRDLSSTLFSESERALMRRFATALGRMVPPEGAVNYSNTAYQNQRMVRDAFRALAGVLGFAGSGGNPGAAIVASGTMTGIQNAATNAANRNLLRPGAARVMQSNPLVGPFAAQANALAAPVADPLTTLLFPSRPE